MKSQKLQTIKEITDAFGVLIFMVGFFCGIFLMIWFVPRTRLINTIPAEQECTTVTVYEQSESFCKEVKDVENR